MARARKRLRRVNRMNRSAPIVFLALATTTPAFAYDDAPSSEAGQDTFVTVSETESGSPRGRPAVIRPFDPPRIDYPGIQSLGPGISLYLDTTYETTDDLSTFWWVKGRGNNYRLALGGTYQNGGLRVNAEVPVQYTQLAIDALMGSPPTDADRTKATLSLGDVIADVAQWWDLGGDSSSSWLGVGMRARFPTHTTRYQFGLIDGRILEFGFPYYLHLAPGALWSMSYGPVSLLVNQGVLAMLAKDITLDGALQPIPNLYFWESHLAAGVDATDWLLLSLEVMSFVQLNRVTVDTMKNLNDTRALFLNPGATLVFGNWRVAVAARIGLDRRSARDFGVITFSGKHAAMARLSYVF